MISWAFHVAQRYLAHEKSPTSEFFKYSLSANCGYSPAVLLGVTPVLPLLKILCNKVSQVCEKMLCFVEAGLGDLMGLWIVYHDGLN